MRRHVSLDSTRRDLPSADDVSVPQHLVQCMCGNNMSVPLLTEAVTVSGTEKETAAVSSLTVTAYIFWLLAAAWLLSALSRPRYFTPTLGSLFNMKLKWRIKDYCSQSGSLLATSWPPDRCQRLLFNERFDSI